MTNDYILSYMLDSLSLLPLIYSTFMSAVGLGSSNLLIQMFAIASIFFIQYLIMAYLVKSSDSAKKTD